ncbi:UNVERIFIED_CONTAM: hypothetical protein Sradi_3239900 [Sesamum radiatum]|uniref:Uncharacterized protein n=1 Tax=Sesamum radiatum TaxID=300843 RepID=A0AAW2RGZ8_SESRA
METPNNTLIKENAVEITGSAQALQVVLGTFLALASGTTVPGPPRSTDPLTEPPRHSTFSNTSSGGILRRK